jgi:hypothetical protein
MEWVTLEVFDSDAAAWAWRDRHHDVVVAAAVGVGAQYWEWHEHRYGVAFEVCLPGDAAVEAFRTAPAVRAAVERAPDPHGVLLYRGRGGASGTAVPRRPLPSPLSGAVALPEPEQPVPVVRACTELTSPCPERLTFVP